RVNDLPVDSPRGQTGGRPKVAYPPGDRTLWRAARRGDSRTGVDHRRGSPGRTRTPPAECQFLGGSTGGASETKNPPQQEQRALNSPPPSGPLFAATELVKTPLDPRNNPFEWETGTNSTSSVKRPRRKSPSPPPPPSPTRVEGEIDCLG